MHHRNFLIRPYRLNRVWGGGGPPPYDPSVLNLSLFLDGDEYVEASPVAVWSGLPSAGSSGVSIATAILAGGIPTTGSLNGIQTVSFNADKMILSDPIFTGLSAWSFWCLSNIASGAGSAPNAAYDNAPFLTDDNFRLTFTSRIVAGAGRLQVYTYDGALKGVETPDGQYTQATWQLMFARCTGPGGLIEVRQGSGGWTNIAGSAPAAPIGATLSIGNNYVGATILGELASMGFSPESFDDTTFDNIKSYINSRFGLSL